MKRAIAIKAREDKSFTGTHYAAAALMNGVLHQQIANLCNGTSRPHRISVHLSNEILRVFGRYGVKRKHFATPK